MHYSISFPADFKNIPPLRELAVHVAQQAEFDKKTSERIRSVLDEMCNNAIEYGSQPTSEVILEIYCDDKNMKITCHDQGHGNKLTAEEINARVAEGKLENGRGRGIGMIIKEFADEWKLTDRPEGGITAEATFHKH